MEFSDKHSHILEVGYIVKADETEDNNAFQGSIVGFDSVYVLVKDQEGNIYHMFGYELELVQIPFK
jgi:hypothetical protein